MLSLGSSIGPLQISRRYGMPSIIPYLLAGLLAVQNVTAQNLPAQDHASRGISLAREGKLPEAELELRDAVHSAPGVASYRAQLGSILGLQEKWNEALEAFQAEGTEGALTRVKKLGQIRTFFCFAFERGRIDVNPARLLRGPKVRPRPTLPFTHEEMSAILSAIDHYPDKSGQLGRANAQRLRSFVLLLRYTGLRIGDATTLSVDRLAGNKILLYTAKTGQPVYCVIPDFVTDILENVPRLSEKYFFWTGRSSLHTATGSWQRTLRRLFRLAGVQMGHAHRFRDTLAVELLLAGVATEEVAVVLGHSNIGITQTHYSPWVRSRQKQLEANLERAWSRDPIVLLNSESVGTSPRPGSIQTN